MPQIVVLAAGFSARLGVPKALARVHGSSLLQRTLDVLSPFAQAQRILVVIPRRATRYRHVPRANRASFLVNAQRATGLSSSVRRGIETARHRSAILLLPVDLAGLERRDIARLLSRWRGARRKVVARNGGGIAVTPLVLPHALFPAARAVTGDRGLRDWVGSLPAERVILVDLRSASLDVDTRRDLADARRRTRYRT